MLRAARARGADVVHANSTRAALSCGLARRLGGPALAVHVHDVLGDDRVSRLVAGVIGSSADVVLANSAYVRGTVEREGGPPVVVVENPVDLARFDPARADGARVRRDLGIATGTPVLALVGQITPWKGQDTAIRALAALPERHRTTQLLIVGEPVFAGDGTRFDNVRFRDELAGLARELGVADRVAFLGARGDVADVLASADVALVPSWEEPFGRVVIEAMALGVPVVATDRGGPPEILASGGGVLASPRDARAWADAVTRLLDDATLRARLGAEGRREARARYGLERFVARVLEGYDVAWAERVRRRARAPTAPGG